MCHNPHTDVKPADAMKSCADAGCHANWRSVAFHAGKAHRKVAEQCRTCHQPHAARVDASDCTGCHTTVRKGGGRSKPPLPFDTLKALQQSLLPVEPRPDSAAAEVHSLVDPGRSRGRGDAPFPDEPPGSAITRTAALADTFSHRTHRQLACITCHTTSSPTSYAHVSAAARLPDLPSPASHEGGLCLVSSGRGDRLGSNGHGQGERPAGAAPRSSGRVRARPACGRGLRRVPRRPGEPRAGGARRDLHRVPRQPPHRRARLRDVPPHRGHHPGARASGRRAPRLRRVPYRRHGRCSGADPVLLPRVSFERDRPLPAKGVHRLPPPGHSGRVPAPG